jgi:hypothetical protein
MGPVNERSQFTQDVTVVPEPTPVSKKIAELNDLKTRPDSDSLTEGLRSALRDRSNRVVARAAELCDELRRSELVGDLIQAYSRMFVDPLKKDPGCLAKTSISATLVNLDSQDIEPYRRGIIYHQYEPVWGGEKDSADQLRANCAMGMVRCATVMEALNRFADLLVDASPFARMGAARAIAAMGRWEGVPLLRIRVRSGESNAEVIGVCCASLLELAADDNWELVSGFLHHVNDDVRIQVALAVAESRLPGAFAAIRGAWQAEGDPSVRGTLLTCLGLLRSKESRDFLVSLIEGEDEAAAIDAIRALAPYRVLDELVQRMIPAVTASASPRLRRVFEEEFRVELRGE